MIIGFRDLFSSIYLVQAMSRSPQSRRISISRLKVGTLHWRSEDGEGLTGTPNSSIASGSEWIKMGFVPTGQVEELKNKASLEVSPPLLNWCGRNLKQMGILVW